MNKLRWTKQVDSLVDKPPTAGILVMATLQKMRNEINGYVPIENLEAIRYFC